MEAEPVNVAPEDNVFEPIVPPFKVIVSGISESPRVAHEKRPVVAQRRTLPLEVHDEDGKAEPRNLEALA